ncbi:MAG: hypothetical protein NW220_22545 [Leptolyngbyaceae cyanobacterium bins.349]|nr:hypothetical protein [Leptolyngbyaceae cyanobacterium bins.349]
MTPYIPVGRSPPVLRSTSTPNTHQHALIPSADGDRIELDPALTLRRESHDGRKH